MVYNVSLNVRGAVSCETRRSPFYMAIIEKIFPTSLLSSMLLREHRYRLARLHYRAYHEWW